MTFNQIFFFLPLWKPVKHCLLEGLESKENDPVPEVYNVFALKAVSRCDKNSVLTLIRIIFQD